MIRTSVFDTKKVTAHNAIIPTTVQPSDRLSADERKLYTLICVTYAACTMPDYEFRSVKATMQAGGVEFSVTGLTPLIDGWKAAFKIGAGMADEDESAEPKLPDLKEGSSATIKDTSIESKRTKPPARYTDGTLIEAMESVAKFVTDPVKKAKLREKDGIGTSATRANILKTLGVRQFIENKGKFIYSTAKGRQLIEWLESKMPALADPGETAVWEAGLDAIEGGTNTHEKFIGEISVRVREYVQSAAKRGMQSEESMTPTNTKCPKSGEPVLEGDTTFKFPGYPSIAFNKEFFGRKMTVEEWAAVVGGESPEFTGFYSNKNKKNFGGRLKVNEGASKIDFDFGGGGSGGSGGGTPVPGVVCPKSGEPVLDTGKTFLFPGYPEFKAWKTVAQRDMTAQEYVGILNGAQEILDGFVSKKGSKFASKHVFDEGTNKASFNFD